MEVRLEMSEDEAISAIAALQLVQKNLHDPEEPFDPELAPHLARLRAVELRMQERLMHHAHCRRVAEVLLATGTVAQA